MSHIDELRAAVKAIGLNGITREEVIEIFDRLEAAEKAVTEAYQRGYATGQEEIETERDALRAKIEAAEKDAAHQKALSDSALRVAEGWEEKCNALHAAVRHEADCVDAAKAEIEAMRAKITEMEKQGPASPVPATGYSNQFPLYAIPGAQPAPSVPDGWKLAPIKPTPSMKTAGIGVEVYQDSPPAADCLTWEEVEAIYTAMIEVAPEVSK